MKNRYNIESLLVSYLSAKGIPFIPSFAGKSTIADVRFSDMPGINVAEEYTPKGSLLRKLNATGQWVFMPVSIKNDATTLELPCGVVNISGRKSIVTTPLVGGVGSINELISNDGYNISIVSVLTGQSGRWPEEEIYALKTMYELSKPLELICALTDVVLADDEKIIIEKVSYPPTPGVEDAQIIQLECRTDKPFRLIIE